GFAASYAPGDIVVAESGDRKLKVSKGERLTVMAAQDGDRLQVRREDGSTLVYPARQLECSVFKVEKQTFAEGDVVRFTRNDAKQDVTNGDRYRVSKVESNQLELTALQPAADGAARTLTLSTQRPQPLDYAYASTVHSAQGMTYNRVLVDMDSYSRTTSLDLYYVAISRARTEARLYTNDRDELSKRLLLPHVKASPVQERIWLEARHQRALARQNGIEVPTRSGVAGGRPSRGEGYARD
ncbi:ATP-binding domain-containing protein, partial [Chromobacterium amazonense]|uniref:ATP-binding domain-containing protein n=1 Tax=Chromobacterium amazonense TaxID=1382803 RepID=UPI003F7B1604